MNIYFNLGKGEGVRGKAFKESVLELNTESGEELRELWYTGEDSHDLAGNRRKVTAGHVIKSG